MDLSNKASSTPAESKQESVHDLMYDPVLVSHSWCASSKAKAGHGYGAAETRVLETLLP